MEFLELEEEQADDENLSQADIETENVRQSSLPRVEYDSSVKTTSQMELVSQLTEKIIAARKRAKEAEQESALTKQTSSAKIEERRSVETKSRYKGHREN